MTMAHDPKGQGSWSEPLQMKHQFPGYEDLNKNLQYLYSLSVAQNYLPTDLSSFLPFRFLPKDCTET